MSIAHVPLLLLAATARFTQVSSSAQYACARSDDGRVLCAGARDDALHRVEGPRGVLEVQVFGPVACARAASNEAWCWRQSAGPVELVRAQAKSVAPFDSGVLLEQPDGALRCFTFDPYSERAWLADCEEHAQRAFRRHAQPAWTVEAEPRCAVRDGSVSCGRGLVLREPTAVAFDGPFKAIAAAWSTACALDAKGEAWCWGVQRTAEGQTRRQKPTRASTRSAKALDMAPTPSNIWLLCLVHEAGEVACMSDEGSWESVTVPGATAVVLGQSHACAIGEKGGVWCWGGVSTALGAPASGEVQKTPLKVPRVSDVVELAAGMGFTCARTRAGRVGCWGASSWTPEDGVENSADVHWIDSAGRADRLSAGSSVVCAVAASRATCWNGAGRDPNSGGRPQRRPSLDGAQELSMGNVICKVSSGKARCHYSSYQSPEDTKEFVQELSGKPTESGVKQIASADDYACTLKAEGSVTCWLENRSDSSPVPDGPTRVLPAQ